MPGRVGRLYRLKERIPVRGRIGRLYPLRLASEGGCEGKAED
ncbi:MAG: hypothetical protein ACO2O2_07585 [Acidilobaceae archaeon]